MIELMLVAVIMGIGLLGLLSLQVLSIASGGQSRMRGGATLKAHNLLDRVVAEGILSSAERYDSGNCTVTSTGWTFIDPTAAMSAHTSTSTENLYYDINGNSVASSSPTLIYTLSWQRMAGVKGSNTMAMQSFVVNVQWSEAVKTSGVTSIQPHYFSVSRNVRI